jgi:hypothetical protein
MSLSYGYAVCPIVHTTLANGPRLDGHLSYWRRKLISSGSRFTAETPTETVLGSQPSAQVDGTTVMRRNILQFANIARRIWTTE